MLHVTVHMLMSMYTCWEVCQAMSYQHLTNMQPTLPLDHRLRRYAGRNYAGHPA